MKEQLRPLRPPKNQQLRLPTRRLRRRNCLLIGGAAHCARRANFENGINISHFYFLFVGILSRGFDMGAMPARRDNRQTNNGTADPFRSVFRLKQKQIWFDLRQYGLDLTESKGGWRCVFGKI